MDDELGGRLASTHLLGLGHRRLGFVGHQSQDTSVREVLRFRGFAAEARQSTARVSQIGTDGFGFEDGRAAGQRLVDMPAARRPSAVFCVNDLLCLGVLNEVLRAGIRVPQQMALVGYDDIRYAQIATVPMTSIRQPRVRLGEVGLELLMAESMKSKEHSHRQVVLKPELVVRGTTVPDADGCP
jgi:LacI family transcriptional regulator